MKLGSRTAQQSGFTLLELAVVLAILGLLIGMGADFVGNYLERQRYTAAATKLSAIDQAIIRHVSVTQRLPCPDTGTPLDGIENTGGTNCAAAVGAVPWRTLGLASDAVRDGQGNLFSYAIDVTLAEGNGMGVTDAADLQDTARGLLVEDAEGTVLQNPGPADFPTGAAYVIFATNPDWYGPDDSPPSLSGTTVTLPKSYISALVRRPSVVEVMEKARVGMFAPS